MKRGTSKTSQPVKKLNRNASFMTQEIRVKIDNAKYLDPAVCELPDKEYDLVTGNDGSDSWIIDDVWVVREGKVDEVMSALDKTTEDLHEEEQEKSRLARAAKASRPGELTPPEAPDYHPKNGPKAS